MKSRLRFLAIYFSAWVLFFELSRLIFLLFNFGEAKKLSAGTMGNSFLYGLRMDVSMASYILLPVILMILAGIFLPFFRRSSPFLVYTFIILLPILLITIADIEVYHSWGFRIDETPFRYLNSPTEALASVSHLPLLRILLFFGALCYGCFYLFRKMINRHFPLTYPLSQKATVSVVLLLLAGAMILPIRGGFQLIPLNQSSVYFSSENFANITAINATWNVMNGFAKGTSLENPYSYLDIKKARFIADSLHANSGNVTSVLTAANPNVIIIIWESFTEKALHTKRNGRDIVPRFRELMKEGIYFSNMYASGDRTDKGVSAVLSGYPAMNNFSIIRFPKKSSKLPTLGRFFKERGYSTSFYYGGETEFANIKSYLLQSNYNELTDKSAFGSGELNSKWGAHDGAAATKILRDLEKKTAPFFLTWLTLTSHEPFEIPEPPAFEGNSIEDHFINSLHYSDKVIDEFISACKSKPWWNNTLVVIVADHGHALLTPSTTLDNRRIPALWLGGALKTKGITMAGISSQLDLATSLAAQIEPGYSGFPYSKNLFDTASNPWAFFTFNNGFAWIQTGKSLVFDNIGRQVIEKKGVITELEIESGKAMQQIIYQDYLEK